MKPRADHRNRGHELTHPNREFALVMCVLSGREHGPQPEDPISETGCPARGRAGGAPKGGILPRFDRIPWDELPTDEAVFAWEAERYTAAAGLLRDAVNAYLDLYWPSDLTNYLRQRVPRLVEELDPDGCATEQERERRLSSYRKQPIPQALRKAVFERDGYRCQGCGGWEDLECDHVVPESQGGPTELGNLQALCGACNRTKRAQVP